jgi:carbon-monoxide dehydrogenase medium subunit
VPKLGESTGLSYLKYRRRSQDWATVGVAALVHHDDGSAAGASVALSCMGGTPLRARGVEDAVASGASPVVAAGHAAEGTDPSSDTAASAEFRMHLARVLTERALIEATS